MKGSAPGRMVAVGMETNMWTCGNLGVDWVMRERNMPMTTHRFGNVVWNASSKEAVEGG